jgi:ACT domain-containing protein
VKTLIYTTGGVMIELQPFSYFGQLKVGDLILIEHKHDNKLVVSPATVRAVVNAGAETEEIIICKKYNKYFITGMYLDGSSWVKNVQVVKRGKVFSMINTKTEL